MNWTRTSIKRKNLTHSKEKKDFVKISKWALAICNILLLSTNLVAQEANCVDGVDNDNDGKIDYLDSDCDCIIGVSNIIKFDFASSIPIVGTGVFPNNKVRYNNVGQIGNTSIDIIATVMILSNISALEAHGSSSGSDDATIMLPNEDNNAGDLYKATIRYQLFESGTTTPFAGSFEIEIADIDLWASAGSGREEAIAVRQNEITNYYLANPTNLTTNFSNNKVTVTGTQIQTPSDANGAVKFLYVNQDEFTIEFSSKQTTTKGTGRAGFQLDGNEFTIFNTCLPPEDCFNGIDDDGDGLIDCDDPDCYLASKSGDSDNDNDGIGDVCDLDDDNDGILDGEEGCVSAPPPSSGLVLGGDLLVDDVTFSAANGAALEKSSITNYVALQSPTGQPEPSGQTFISGYDAAGGQGSAVVNLNTPITYQIVNELVVRIQYYNSIANTSTPSYVANPSITLNTDQGNLTLTKVLTTTEKNTIALRNWIPLEFRVPITGNTVTLNGMTLKLEGISGGIGNFIPASSEVFAIGFDFVGSDIVCRDTDNDGIIDSKDLDSDGDGCLDVAESGGSDGNNDGILDGSGVNNQGQITGGTGGYDGASGSEIIASKLTVTNSPSNKTKNTGESTSFSVTARGDAATSYNAGTPLYAVQGNANSNINYQWYLGNPNTTGTPISNSGIYSNATTATLNISNVAGLNGRQYCVLVSHNNNPCIEEIKCAILSVNSTEICGDGQDNDGDGLIDCADSDCNPFIADVIPTDLNCPLGADNGKIIITATGPGSLTYSISNEANYQSSNTFNNLGQGLYTIRVKSSTGCVATYNNAIIQMNTPNCPEICDDGIDNDGDGLIDCDDPDCELSSTNNVDDN